MFKFKSNNPIINESRIEKMSYTEVDYAPMTVRGAIDKTFILFFILLATTVIGFQFPTPLLVYGGAIGGLIVVIISVFKKEKSPVLAPVYAILEGLFVGGISAMYSYSFGGIISQAVILTFSVLIMMLIVYRLNIIPVTNKFRAGIVMATGAIALVYVLSFVLHFFGIQMPYLHDGGMIGIGISLFIIAIAAMNLLLDFDNFEKGEQHGMPQYMEWFFAMGLIITLVWLYIEILRLLSKLNRD